MEEKDNTWKDAVDVLSKTLLNEEGKLTKVIGLLEAFKFSLMYSKLEMKNIKEKVLKQYKAEPEKSKKN